MALAGARVMGKVDYEAAWNDLQQKLLTREGWGTRTLITEMADIAVQNRVPEGPLERFFRMYSGRLARAVAAHLSTAEATADSLTGTTPVEREPDPARVKTQEVAHDGSRNSSRTAVHG